MKKNPFKMFTKPARQSEPTRHAKRSWKKRAVSFGFSNATLALTLVFLFLPLFVIVFYSFNEAKDTTWTKFSLVWYEKLVFGSSDLWASLWNSVFVAVVSSLVATVLGTLAAIGITWYKFRGKNYIQTTSFLPMVLPEVIMGVSLLIFFKNRRV